ncbi:COX2 oxidase, partial [Acromyrmex heyeri]
ISLQNSNSPTYDIIILFHDFTIIILTFITTLILFIIFKSLSNKFINRFLLEHHIIEIILSFNFPIRILSTSIDVIYYGIFFGHCSEICDINHSFVPIVIEATNLINFKI